MKYLSKPHSTKGASFGFAAALLLALAVALVSFEMLRGSISKTYLSLNGARQKMIELEKLRSANEERTASYRGYFLTGDRSLMDKFQIADTEQEKYLDKILSEARNPMNKKILEDIQRLHIEHSDTVNSALDMKANGVSATKILKYFDDAIWPKRRELSKAIDSFIELKEVEFERQEKALESDSQRAIVYIYTAGGIGILSALGLAYSSFKKVRRVANELKEANEELDRFTSVVAHDLKEPARTNAMFLQLLQSESGEKISSQGNSYITIAVDASKRMIELIESLLKQAKTRDRNHNTKPIHLSEIVQEAIANLKSAIHEKSAEIKEEKLPVVVADRSQMVQLFQNLIGNGIKYQPPGNVPKITIGAEQKKGYWTIYIKDNGIGFSPEESKKIFHSFYRLHNRSQYSGTGLGLSVCKRIVERHKGKIWAESHPGAGAAFYFTLPKVA